MTAPSVLENQFLKLDVTIDPTFRVTLTDKRTGALWDCPGPPFVLHAWEALHYAGRVSPVLRDLGWEFRILPEESEIAVQCAWPRAACSFRAVFRLAESSLDVLLPGKRLVENRPFDVRQMALDILPGFGGARTGEAGFLLIPRGLGTLCRFNKTNELEAPQLIYADGDRALTAPVFGISRAQGGFLGIICDGEFSAELVVAANHGPDRTRNSIFPRIRPRLQPGDRLDEDTDYAIRYTLLDPGDASYAAMARAYRTYLLDTAGQPPLAQRCKLRPRLAYAAAAPTVHVQLAEKRRLTRMSGDGALMIKTRFEEVSTIVKIMKAAGLESAVVVLSGWNCEGRDGLYPTRFPVESAVGGADAMTRAINDVRTAGYLPGALDNYTDMYRRSPAFNGDFTCLQLGGEPWRGGVWAGGQSYVICPKQALDRYVQRDMRRLYDLRLEGLLFLDHCPGPGILSCCHEQHPLTRAQYAKAIGDIIRAAQSTFGLCRVSGLSVFAALMADSCVLPVVDTPHIDGLGEDWFADETVPFLPIALHGLILPAADAQADLLRVVEYGAAPIYSVTAGDAPQVIDKMRGFCPRYISQIAPLANEFIESHETPAEGLIKTRYSNGVSVLINRTGKPVELDGVRVGARDFQVRQC